MPAWARAVGMAGRSGCDAMSAAQLMCQMKLQGTRSQLAASGPGRPALALLNISTRMAPPRADSSQSGPCALCPPLQAHEGGGPAGGSGGPPSPTPASPGTSPSSPATAPLDAALAAPLGEQERLAVERAVACALLELVYDASPLVRSVRQWPPCWRGGAGRVMSCEEGCCGLR